MISMNVMSTNETCQKSIYSIVQPIKIDKTSNNIDPLCQGQNSFDITAVNLSETSNTTFLTQNPLLTYIKNSSTINLSEKSPVQKTSKVVVAETKECRVCMPKLNKNLDVHLNKTKTINLKNLKVLVAKNIIHKDSIILDNEPRKVTTHDSAMPTAVPISDISLTMNSVPKFTTTSQCQRNLWDSYIKKPSSSSTSKTESTDQQLDSGIIKECGHVLSKVLNDVFVNEENTITNNLDVSIPIHPLEENQNQIHSLVEGIVNQLIEDNENESAANVEDAENRAFDTRSDKILNVDGEDNTQLEDDVRSSSSDYVSLQLSSSSDESEEEEDNKNGNDIEDFNIKVDSIGATGRKLVLEWFDTDSLPTPSPKQNIEVNGEELTPSDSKFQESAINTAEDDCEDFLVLPLDSSEEDSDSSKQEVENTLTEKLVKSSFLVAETANKTQDNSNDCIIQQQDMTNPIIKNVHYSTKDTNNDTEKQEVIDQKTPDISNKTLNDIDNDDKQQKVVPLKLFLKDIQKANDEKIVSRVIKKFSRLSIQEEGETNLTQQEQDFDWRLFGLSPLRPKLKKQEHSTVSSLIVFTKVDDNHVIETVDFEGKNKIEPKKANTNEEPCNETIKTSTECEMKVTNSKHVPLKVFESMADEVSRDLNFDLEDAVSFKASAMDLLSIKDKVTAKRKKQTQKIRRQVKMKCNGDKVERKFAETRSDNIKKTISSDEEFHPTSNSDEEFCPTSNNDSYDSEQFECIARKTRASTTDDTTATDPSFAYKRKLRKRQKISLVDEVYSDIEDIEEEEVEKCDTKEPDDETNKRKLENTEVSSEVATNVVSQPINNNYSPISSYEDISPETTTQLPVSIPEGTSEPIEKECQKTSSPIDLTKPTDNKTDKIETDVPIEPQLIIDCSSSMINNVPQNEGEAPLDLSKKLVQNTKAVDGVVSNKNDPLLPKINRILSLYQDIKQAEMKEMYRHQKEKTSGLEKSIVRVRNDSVSKASKVSKTSTSTSTTASVPVPASIAGPLYPIHNSDQFRTEYQKLRRELAALDFVAEQKEREKNNILQLKRHKLALMQQLQFRKQLLTRPQVVENTRIAQPTATLPTLTLAPTTPQLTTTTPCAPTVVTTSTRVMPSVKQYNTIVRPIVTKASPPNKPVMPVPPKPGAAFMVPSTNWPGPGGVPYRHDLSVINKATENIGIQWITDGRGTLVPVIQPHMISALTAGIKNANKSTENSIDKTRNPEVARQLTPTTAINGNPLQDMTSNGSRLPDNYRNSTLARLLVNPTTPQMGTKSAPNLLVNDDNNDNRGADRRLAPKWPTCQSCRNQMARFICAGCNKQWYCSEKCQIADWKMHFKTCKK